MTGSSTVRIEWKGDVVGALEDVDDEAADVGDAREKVSGRWVPIAGPRTAEFLEALAEHDQVELKAEGGYVTAFSVDRYGTGTLLTRSLPPRRAWEHRLRSRAQRCAECGSWSYPVPASGDLYRCPECRHESAGPLHNLETFAESGQDDLP